MMTISTKGRYGLRMLLDIAEHCGNGYVPLIDIARRQNVSKKYLEQIVPVFVKAGILRTTRGSQGGYALTKSPEKYTVGMILRLTEGDFSPVPCASQNPIECERSQDCATLYVWQGLYGVVTNYLDNITLQDILDKQRDPDTYDYSI